MVNIDGIYLCEYSQEAIDAVKSGEAVFGPGGIRRRGEGGKGFLELSKTTTLSVADFKSLFEDKDHAFITDERIQKIESQLPLSMENLKEIENLAWLNNTLNHHIYTLTYQGFQETLVGIEKVSAQMAEFEQYVKQQNVKDLKEKAQTYVNYMKSDAGKLQSEKFDVINSNIDEHLDQIDAFIKRLFEDIEKGEDCYQALQILMTILVPYSYLVRRYSALFFYENDGKICPGNYEGWIKTIRSISKSKLVKEKVDYYIQLNTMLPFSEKVRISQRMRTEMVKLIRSIEFEQHYIENHSKEDYLTMDKQIVNAVENENYYLFKGKLIIFLEESKGEKK